MKNFAATVTVGFLMLSVLSPNADAQAFGIRMGQKVASLDGAVEHKESRGRATRQYSVKTVPLPHSEFESYTVLETTKQGICKVVGIGKTHSADKYGVSLRSAFDDLDAALTSKYGEGKKFDFLHSGSIWSDADEFAMSLRLEERSLSKFWEMNEGAISSIALTAHALSPTDTYLRINYEFTNFEDCIAENKLGDQDGL
jgi:hypothetical protein